MKKYSIVLSPEAVIPSIISRIQSYPYYRLYSNVFFIKTDNTPKEIYSRLISPDNKDIRLVVFEIADNYWGYASKDFWPWIRDDENTSK